MAERKSLEVGPDDSAEDYVAKNEAKRSVVVNRDALNTLALYGAQDKVEPFYHEVQRTFERLELPTSNKTLQGAPNTKANAPNILDVKRWLDSLDPDNPECDEDVTYLLKLHATLASRMPPKADETVEEA